MERLSLNPYPLRRLGTKDYLPFIIPDEIVLEVAGATLWGLYIKGRLFLVDHK
jgi:hypothetical protein